MTENQHTQNLNAIAQDIDALAKQAYQQIISKIGTAPVSVIIKEVLKGYAQEVQLAVDSMMRDYLSLGTQSDKPLATVGKVTLSQALYANAALTVTPVVTRLINESAQQITTARELSRLIYDGYDFQDDPLKVQKELPKYLVGNLKKSIAQAKTLKTPHLKAAYLQALGRIEKGAHQDALNKALQVAFYERNRYLANRIAQTELHRVHTDTIASEMMADNALHWVQVKMSGTHPKYDICDYHSSLNAYGKGAGIYPKAKAPKPPYHPFCLCKLSNRYDLDEPIKPPLENKSAQREFINSLSKGDAIAILGSEAKYFNYRMDKDLTVLDIVDKGKPEGYETKMVGSIASLSNKELKEKAKEYARHHFKDKTVTNDETGNDILLSMSGVGHTLQGAKQDLISSVYHLDKIIKKAVLVESLSDKHSRKQVISVEKYEATMTVNDKQLDLIMTVFNETSGRRYYDHAIKK